MAQPRGEAFRIIDETRPAHTYRAAVVGCGRMGSTIDDEHIGMAHYPWPWAHAPAIIEARGTDLVAVTTRPEERAEVVTGLAEAGVKAIFATKPMCRTLAEADAMIDACHQHGTILTMACHLNWYGWYTSARQAIANGAIGELRSMVCHSAAGLSNIGSHILALMRLFVGAPASWVFGCMDSDDDAAGESDLRGSGYIVYENGVRAFLNSRSESDGGFQWTHEFIGDSGRIVSRNTHAQFELWTTDPDTGGSVMRQFPNPWYPRSSMVDAIEGVCRSIEAGEELTCPGEFAREALEIAIAMRESHRRGHVRVDLPLADRSLRLG